MANTEPRKPSDLANRVFNNPRFQIPWAIFLFFVVIFVGWPIRNFLLVCWVYSRDAYFRHGLRVLPGKPIRFSNGILAPTVPDLVTGFGVFLATVFGLSLLLIFILRAYERANRSNRPSDKGSPESTS